MDQSTTELALQALELLVGRWAMQVARLDGQPWPGRATRVEATVEPSVCVALRPEPEHVAVLMAQLHLA